MFSITGPWQCKYQILSVEAMFWDVYRYHTTTSLRTVSHCSQIVSPKGVKLWIHVSITSCFPFWAYLIEQELTTDSKWMTVSPRDLKRDNWNDSWMAGGLWGKAITYDCIGCGLHSCRDDWRHRLQCKKCLLGWLGVQPVQLCLTTLLELEVNLIPGLKWAYSIMSM